MGDRQVKVKFAFLPKRIDNMWVWLESYFQHYTYVTIFNRRGGSTQRWLETRRDSMW